MVAQEQAQNEQRRLIDKQSRRDARRAQYRDYEAEPDDQGGIMSNINKTFDSWEESANEYMNGLNGAVNDGKSSLLKSAFKAKFF